MPSLALSQHSLHYLDVGSGPPLVLLHAFPLHAGSFASQISALSGSFRVLAPDARGFGQSTLPGEITRMTDLADDVAALLDQLGITSAVVGGVSMGGYAALALTRELPGRISGLLLLDTQATADDEAARAARMDLLRDVDARGVTALLERQVPKLLAGDTAKAAVEAMVREASVPAVKAALRGLAERDDSRGILARFHGPALVLVGEQDTVTPRAKAEEMHALVAGSTLVEIPGAGHLAHLEAPDSVNAALHAFLRACA